VELLSLAAIIEALAGAGATPEMLAAAVRADQDERQATAHAAAAEKRAKAAERQRRKRERDNEAVTRSHAPSREVTPVTRDTLEEKVSPRPPSKTQSLDTSSPPKGGSGSAILPFAKPNGFDRFWEAYPRKTGKGGARKAFAKALLKIGGADPQAALMVALERVKPTWTEGRYIPHPATWLNDERWEDEPEIPPPKGDEFAEARARVLAGFDGDSARNHG
jgi:hypothetical protein